MDINSPHMSDTIEIYSFSLLLHLYVFFFEKCLYHNPFLSIIYLTFAYPIIYSLTGYSITSFAFHPIWYHKTYEVAVPQLIHSINNVLILKNDYNIPWAMTQSVGMYYAIEYNFHDIESSKSMNIRALVSIFCFTFKYFIEMILNT
jgi:hypothetical protein